MKKTIRFFLINIFLFIFIFSLLSCNKNNNNQEKTSKIDMHTVIFDSCGGSDVSSQEIEDGKKVIKPTDPTKEGYTFDDWYYQGEKWSFIGYVVTDDMTLEAKWNINSYTLNLDKNVSEAGNITGSGTYDYNESVTITATINDGYSFVGWYDGNTKVSDKSSYTFDMPAKNLSYTARWSAKMSVSYKVEHYQQNIDDDNYPTTPYETDNLTGRIDTKTNAEVNTYEGFTSPTVIQENIKEDGSTVIKLYYTRNTYTISVDKNLDKAGTINEISGTYKYGKEITISAETNQGYRFDGWYNGNNQVYEENSKTFNMPAENLSYTAKWTAIDSYYKVEHYLQNIDDDNYPDIPFAADPYMGTTDTLTTASIRIFNGFTAPTAIEQKTINGDGSTVIKLYYTRNSYNILLDTNNTKAGSITDISGSYKYGKEITISAQTNPGYTFDGWYYSKIRFYENESNTFKMPAENLYYKATWIANTNTAYKVEHYQQNLDNNNYPDTPFETDNLTGTTDTLTNAQDKNYNGFTLTELIQANINGNGSTVIKLYYERDSYDVSFMMNNDKAGTITDSSGTYKYGEKITITAETNPGYIFDGWFINGMLFNMNASFDYTITGTDTVIATYSINEYTITIDIQTEGIIVTGVTSGNEYEFDSQITLTAENIPAGYIIKWTRDDIDSYENTYSFKVPAEDVTISVATSAYKRIENKIYFGSYPQTRVTDDKLKSELDALAEYLPTSTNLYNWTDYNYYINSQSASYMYYQDIDYDKNGTYDYRGVYFTQYRPYYSTSTTSSKDLSLQDNNGYFIGEIYWFSYDPIEWIVINEKEGKALIISNLLLDSQDYYPTSMESKFDHNDGNGYANNYELSNIRKFLNEDFYNTAFSDLLKEVIEKTIVDNSVESTGRETNKYVCNDTEDKIFLLSVADFYIYPIRTDDELEGTEYAKCQGLEVYNFGSSNDGIYWWLRSPATINARTGYRINQENKMPTANVFYNGIGVRPACWINL